MNNAQFKIKVKSLDKNYTNKNVLQVSGRCEIKYRNRGEDGIQEIDYQAFGNSAIAIEKTGFNFPLICSGSVNLLKPEDLNSGQNIRVLFNIQSAFTVLANIGQEEVNTKIEDEVHF